MMSSNINIAHSATMGNKSKKIFTKRFESDFERVCGELGFGLTDSISIDDANKLLGALGFIKTELRQK